MTDAAEPLRLGPGERVLWQGRAAVGAPWPPVGHVLGVGALATVVVGLGFLACTSSELAVLAAGLVGLITIVVTLSKWVGPSYLLLAWLVSVTPAVCFRWSQLLQVRGWGGALSDAYAEMGLGVFFIALPLFSLVSEALMRLDVIYLITDRRVVSVLGGARPLTLWDVTRLGAQELRLERSWRAPGGYLVAGMVRRLHLRDDDPARVLETVSAERAARDA